ncbi:hypothetical protein D9615_001008 [Tricholomella constricta]|uniref:Uncharacterized protein n=1 Tax=Tricholomella constricta TaxID=117010 RepID=A0A8H5HKW3_9AGAR|nr:hypothetical protein D9615_001008 [Tricholomella constricta]
MHLDTPGPSRTAPSRNRGPWRAYFHDHPKLKINNSIAMATGKAKVYCKRCFNAHTAAAQLEDAHEVQVGRRVTVRSVETIEEHLWAIRDTNPQSSIGWLRAASGTLKNHLRTCLHQPQEVRNEYAQESPRRRQQSTPPPLPPTLATPFNPAFNFDPSSSLSSLSGPSHQYSDARRHFFALDPSSFGSPPPGSLSPSPSLAPSDSISRTGSHTRSSHARSLSLGYKKSGASKPVSRVGSTNFDLSQWSDARQASFERAVARLTASAGFSLSWVDNIEWLNLLEEFIPAAKSPSRKVLTKCLIPALISELRAEAKANVKGKNATVQADGWTGENHHHLIAFMITVGGKLHTVKVHDASTERKTTENLLRVLEEVVEEIERDWEATVIAVVTDASGESRKARRLYGKKYPWIIVLDCYAHQINLIVGDYFKSNKDVLAYTDLATELIAWLRSKTLLLGLIRQSQIATHGRTLAIIRAVLTRWTAHYLAFNRLLELRDTLLSVIYADEARPEAHRMVIIGDRKTKIKSRAMIAIVKNPLFWHAILRMTRHLRPLAIAANIVQAAFCRVDQVLLTFGFLTMQYRAMTDEDDASGVKAILESIEKRWAKADQEVFIAAVILNPIFQSAPFAPLSSFNNAGIHTLLEHLWIRVFRSVPPVEFYQQLKDYLAKSGMFANLESQCQIENNIAQREGRTINPMNVFDSFCFPDRPWPALIQLASRILSISANSASCERLFSAFGNTLTKLRNRLGVGTLTALTELKMHIRDEHVRKQSKDRVKRQFTARNSSTTAPSAMPAEQCPSIAITPVATAAAEQPPLASREEGSFESGLNDDGATEPNAEQSSPGNDFRSIASSHSMMVDLDDRDNHPVRDPDTIGHQIPISELFDFSRTHWVDTYSHVAERSFDEELALYELLDLDADGEEDADIGVDDSMEDVLIG